MSAEHNSHEILHNVRRSSTIVDNTPREILFTVPFHALQTGYCVKLRFDPDSPGILGQPLTHLPLLLNSTLVVLYFVTICSVDLAQVYDFTKMILKLPDIILLPQSFDPFLNRSSSSWMASFLFFPLRTAG